MTAARRVAVAAVVLPVAAAILLGGEVVAAQRGTHLPAPAPPPPDDRAGPLGPADRLVVWLGDSTAAGMGASGPAGALPRQVADLLGRPVRLTVLARSGHRVGDALRLQLPALAGLAPDAVFISIGANDVIHLTRRSDFRRDYAGLLSGLPGTVGQVVLLGVPHLGAAIRLRQPLLAVAAWRGRALDRDVRRLAARRGAVYVDIAGLTGLAFRRHPGRYLAADRYHPADAGYRLWAVAVAETLAGAADGPGAPSS